MSQNYTIPDIPKLGNDIDDFSFCLWSEAALIIW